MNWNSTLLYSRSEQDHIEKHLCGPHSESSGIRLAFSVKNKLKQSTKLFLMKNHTIVFVRHGESEWNHLNLFTGWYDCGLSPVGFEEARKAGKSLRE